MHSIQKLSSVSDLFLSVLEVFLNQPNHKKTFFENLEASDCFIALGAPRKRQLTELQQPLKLAPKGFNQSPGRMYR